MTQSPKEWENKLETLGLFSLESSISIGDQYGVRPEHESRVKGKQFGIISPKGGKLNDSTFSSFTSLKVGDKYVTAEEIRRSYEKEKKHRNLFPGKPFVPSSPTKLPTGAGTIYGVFQNFSYMKTSDDYDKKSGKQSTSEIKRNFLTSPAKKGRFGSVGVNIGGKPEGVAGEFAYSPPNPQPFPVPPRPKSESETLRPFTPASPTKKGTYGYVGLNLSGSATGAYGEYKYESDGLFTRPRRTSMTGAVKPFVPSSPPRSGTGIYGTVGHFPSYMEDPIEEKRNKELTRRQEERQRILGTTRIESIAKMRAAGINVNLKRYWL